MTIDFFFAKKKNGKKKIIIIIFFCIWLVIEVHDDQVVRWYLAWKQSRTKRSEKGKAFDKIKIITLVPVNIFANRRFTKMGKDWKLVSKLVYRVFSTWALLASSATVLISVMFVLWWCASKFFSERVLFCTHDYSFYLISWQTSAAKIYRAHMTRSIQNRDAVNSVKLNCASTKCSVSPLFYTFTNCKV